MAIKAWAFDSRLAESFIDLGDRLYKDDPKWIPPFKKDLRAQLAADYPFYKKCGNAHQHFLAVSGDRVLGRISASVNSASRDSDGTPVGSLGFFECVEDYAVAEDLLESSLAWLRDIRGPRRIWGPMNFDIWHGYRFMTKGFDEEPFYGEPYNKPYYPEYFERFGFSVKQEWDSLEIRGRGELEALLPRGEERLSDLVRKGYRFVPFNLGSWAAEVRKLHGFLTDSFRGFLGWTPISPEEFLALYQNIRYALNPRLAAFVYDEEGCPAGFVVALVELADAVRAMGGKDGPASRLRFLRLRRRADRVNFYIGGLTAREMAKKSGLGRAGYAYVVRGILEQGYDRMIQSLIVKKGPSHNFAGSHRLDINREYALYELNL